MGGGIIQLVAYGSQDIYLTGNPQITFFKIVHKRYTNFAVESIKQSFINEPELGKKSTCIISKNGDLIQQMYLDITLPILANSASIFWTHGIGNAIIKSAEIQIGGTTIDTQYGVWMDIWTELTNPTGQRINYDNMVGNKIQSGNVGLNANTEQKLFVPLLFWFNRNPGLALPIVALHYHDVRLILDLRPLNECYTTTASVTLSTNLIYKFDFYVDYIFLDTDERRKFAQTSHEYLIEQVQTMEDKTIVSGTTQILAPIKFYHPVKEIVWVIPTVSHNIQKTNDTSEDKGNRWLNYSSNDNYTSTPEDVFETATIEMNGSPRFYKRYANYFRLVQNYQRHTNSPRVPNISAFNGQIYGDDASYSLTKYIYTYSFALTPEEHQPSGTCNFSKLNSVNLALTFGGSGNSEDQIIKIFGVNYNVLRVFNGQAGLAYSN